MASAPNTKKQFVFRFDIDTIKCINLGVDNLIDLGNKYNVKFVFFVNMGKAISIRLFFKAFFSERKNNNKNSLSALRKLGIKDYLYTAVVNPNVGLSNTKNIERLIENGHEVGLHGGKNHAEWAENILSMSEKEIREDLNWSYKELQRIVGLKQMGFASPEWQGGAKLRKVLSEMGFMYCADAHGIDARTILSNDYLPLMPTNIISEPGGVGFFESIVSQNIKVDDFKKIITEMTADLDCAVVYDHPYFAGDEGLYLVEETIKHVQDLGFNVVTYRDML